MSGSSHSVDDAYAIGSPEEAARLYDDWAGSYDADLTGARGYALPERIAASFLRRAEARDAPVLDVGAGTGLVGAALAGDGPAQIDGIDISAGMLASARDKGCYRALIEADLTRPLDLEDGAYGALISAGTFTHGHVGPEVLPELLRLARPGALCVFGILPAVFDGAGFGSALALLVADGRIGPLDFERCRVYAREDHDHGRDEAFAVIFRKTG